MKTLRTLGQFKAHPAAMALLLAGLLLNTAFVWYLDTQRTERQQLALAQTAQSFLNQLQLRLERNFTTAYAIAAGIMQQGNEHIDFSSYAKELLAYYPDIQAISLAPQGVIEAVYPLTGNEALLGFDMFAHPGQQQEARRAKAAGELRLNGPFSLVQGGFGVVGRLPLVVQSEDPAFWGFINVTLQLDPILDSLQTEFFQSPGVRFHLWRQAPDQSHQSIRQHPQFHQPEQSFTLPLADNPWQLDLHYVPSWQERLPFWLELVFGLLSSLMLYGFALFYLQMRGQRGLLAHQVTERTQELQQTLERYRSFVQASDTGGWEYDQSRNFLKCSREYFSMLGRDRQGFDQSGKDNLASCWLDLIHPDDVAAASQAFLDYLQQPIGLYESQFRMRHQNGDWVWVLSRGRTLTGIDGTPSSITVGTHIDISRQKQSELKLKLLEQLFEQSSEGMLITDPEQKILLVNRAFCQISGYTAEEVQGKTPSILSSGKHDKSFYQAMQQAIQRHGSWQGEIWNRRKNGELYPEWLSISQILNAKGQLTHYVASFSDISSYKQDQEKLNFLAHFDSLTQLPNRTLLLDRTEQAIQRAKRNHSQLAMLFIDLDRFKKINDSLGHQVGDELLVQAAQRLKSLTRSQDTLSRLSSDEFILLLPDTDQQAAGKLAGRILQTLQTPYFLTRDPLSVSASIGIAIYPADGDNFFDLNKHADIAMFQAKENGRNSYCFFTAGMQSQFNRSLQLENALRHAIERDQLQLVYQPQYCLLQQRLTGFEALLRWQHPELGFISPAEFIPIAESSGLMTKLGDWVLQHAIQQQKAWQQAGFEPLVMAINLSPVQFRQPDLLSTIVNQLQLARLPANQIELEITESAMVDDAEKAIATVNAIREAGIQVAIDDFGTGYSSLSYLKRFKLNKLKIDQSFVRDLLDDQDDRAIVTAIIRLAQSLGLKTIAEGVETSEHQGLLQQLGCEAIQGYHYGRPMPAEAATAFIQQAFAQQQA
ncbi:EAL domain-containing protein [Alkalimonas delamerensis]|uniref:EAL domain-containing protein n=1 Tax=Alkalimonas delamerensis TaxID=265981 RepID=A0ABT9GLY1_9GAMM|nr:EAL domain-containing protein [Alkalimonas delamerensis]MDP4527971.1 EAL domain-containing protein [Alkalimonas delamerensis]